MFISRRLKFLKSTYFELYGKEYLAEMVLKIQKKRINQENIEAFMKKYSVYDRYPRMFRNPYLIKFLINNKSIPEKLLAFHKFMKFDDIIDTIMFASSMAALLDNDLHKDDYSASLEMLKLQMIEKKG